MRNRRTGRWGEVLACQYLQSLGYTIVGTNWRSAEGEIDVVARDGDTLVFVEVKARATRRFGLPEEAITRRKMLRLNRAGLAYLEAHGLIDTPWRIDVLAIELGPDDVPERVTHYSDAVEDVGGGLP